MPKHSLSREETECLRGCSTYPQYHKMREGFENEVCPFCVVDRKLNEILYEGDYWVAWKVPPALTTRQSTLDLQIVFFPKYHARHLNDLTINEREEYWKVIDWVYKKFKIRGGVFFTRVGDMRYNVGTIPHLHFNLYVPNREGEVIIPLQKSKETWTEHNLRMQGFAKRYETGEVPEEI